MKGTKVKCRNFLPCFLLNKSEQITDAGRDAVSNVMIHIFQHITFDLEYYLWGLRLCCWGTRTCWG